MHACIAACAHTGRAELAVGVQQRHTCTLDRKICAAYARGAAQVDAQNTHSLGSQVLPQVLHLQPQGGGGGQRRASLKVLLSGRQATDRHSLDVLACMHANAACSRRRSCCVGTHVAEAAHPGLRLDRRCCHEHLARGQHLLAGSCWLLVLVVCCCIKRPVRLLLLLLLVVRCWRWTCVPKAARRGSWTGSLWLQRGR